MIRKHPVRPRGLRDNSYGFLYSGFRGPRDLGFGLGGLGFFAPALISGDNGFLLLLIGILQREQRHFSLLKTHHVGIILAFFAIVAREQNHSAGLYRALRAETHSYCTTELQFGKILER